MGPRIYNILFHTHTVSGIVISVALYVIFFAGSFSFFRDEIVNWERAHSVSREAGLQADFNSILQDLDAEFGLQGRDVEFRQYYHERKIAVNLGNTKDTVAAGTATPGSFFYLDKRNHQRASYEASYTLGEFLYRLHFLAQIPYPYGYYLSGFVAFFFLFAIITGILVHWKKIIPNFFLFRPRAKLKSLWTDAHTALGVLGLPFQFIYAVTGAFFMLQALLVAPAVWGLFEGDESALYETLEYSHPEYPFDGRPLAQKADINFLAEKTRTHWKDFVLDEIHIFNYGDTNMHVSIGGHLAYASQFTGAGHLIYKVADGSLAAEKDPYTGNSYLDGVKNALYRLHLGDYGGYFLRIVSFVLGLIGCFVILSGVLIWFSARNKKGVTERKRKFNEGVARWYLSICLSMYPVTAAAFILVKCLNPLGMQGIYAWYFLLWAGSAAFFIVRKRDARYITRYCLLWGSVLGGLIPLANGLVTGSWVWVSLTRASFHMAFVDLFWIALAILGLLVYGRMGKAGKHPNAGTHAKKNSSRTRTEATRLPVREESNL